MTSLPRRPSGPALALLVLLALALAGCRDSGTAPSADGGREAAAATPTAPPTEPQTSPSVSGSGAAGRPAGHLVGRFARYVALGDSYTSAPGITGPTTDRRCLRAARNYPHLLAQSLRVGTLVDVSCGGADTTDVRGRQYPETPPQLDAVTAGTDLVTIGLGGNDFDLFGSLLAGCLRQDAATVAGSPCTDRLSASSSRRLPQIRERLRAVVRAVRAKAPRARIVLVGYPQLLPASGTCAAAPFPAGDYAFARALNRGFTRAVAAAARAERVTYVDVWRASAGHDICSADPWVNGLTGPGAAPFHPFAVEQEAVARLVTTALA